MQVHITATIMPSPALLRAGAEPEKHIMETTSDTVADHVRTLIAAAVHEGVFEASGTVVLMVQPIYRQRVAN